MSTNYTTIRIREETKSKLTKLGRLDDTYDSVIDRIATESIQKGGSAD